MKNNSIILLLSYSINSICAWAVTFLIPLIILELTNSAISVSVAYATGTLPYLFVMPIAGALGDTYNKKTLIQIGELISATLLLLSLFIPFHTSAIWVILTCHFLVSAAIALHHPIFQAIIPEVVAKEEIPNFNVYMGVINNVISISAPSITGFCLLFFSKKSYLFR